MSIQAVAWVLDHSASRGTDRLVLISLANHANEENEAWPSQRRIAREAGLGVGTITESCRRLLALGELELVREGTPRVTAKFRFTYRPGARKLSAARDASRALCSADERSEDERSARPRDERSAQPRAVQIHQEPSISPPGGPQAAPQGNVSHSVERLVAGFVADWRTTHNGKSPSRSFRNTAARMASRLVDDGERPEVVALCLGVCARENKHPRNLELIVGDYHAEVPA